MQRSRRNAWLVWAYYFFFYGAVGCLIPYLPLYYQSIGLSGEQIGWLLGVGAIVLLVSGPFWSAIGDRFNLHRWLLPITTIGTFLPLFLVVLTNDFVLLLIIIIFQAFFANGIVPLIDSAALEISERANVPFGQMRLGGSLGYTVLALLMGWLLNYIPLVWIFYSYIIAMIVAALVALPLPAREQHWGASRSQGGIKGLLWQPALLLFLIAAYLIGSAANSVNYYLPLFLKSLGGDSTMVGIVSAAGALSEMPVMFTGNRIIKRLGGVWMGVALATFFFILRWTLLSFATTPVMVLILQLFHGLSFALFLLSAIAYVQTQSPAGLSATAQALLSAAMWGFGAFTGSVGGGFVYGQFGSVNLWRLGALACLLAFGLLFGSRLASKRAPHESANPTA